MQSVPCLNKLLKRQDGNQKMETGSHRKSSTENNDSRKRNGSGKQTSSRGFLWESTVFAAVFSIIICIYVYVQTGRLDVKTAAISFAGMFLACTILLGGVRRSVEKRLASLEDEENEFCAGEGADEAKETDVSEDKEHPF